MTEMLTTFFLSLLEQQAVSDLRLCGQVTKFSKWRVHTRLFSYLKMIYEKLAALSKEKQTLVTLTQL